MAAKKSPAKASNKKSGGKKLTTSEIQKQLKRLDRTLLSTIDERARLVAALMESMPDPVADDESLNLSPPIKSGATEEQQDPDSDLSFLFRQINSYCQSQSRPRKVSYLGPVFSYSYLAATKYFGSFHELIPLNSIAAVFSQVASGESDFGVVPIENSTDGRIADTLTMFSRRSIAIYREIHLPIHHCLIGKGKVKDIREIRSKAQALSQCRNWLDQTFSSKVQRVATNSSSDAAQDAREMGKHVAAIASREAAIGLDLKVIAPNIEDQTGNLTRFAVIVNPENPNIQLPGKTGKDKTSIMFGIPHKPGALADVINIFKRCKLNLTWIESFPKPGAFSEYIFFAEFQGHCKEVKVRNALASLDKKTEELTFLGSYPEFN